MPSGKWRSIPLRARRSTSAKCSSPYGAAVRSRNIYPNRRLDFGEEWTRRTGLPFVFAVWLIRPEVKEPERVADAFREIARRGQLQMEEIIARQREHPAEFVRRYLTEFIRFGLGVGEKRGIEQFRTLLCKHALLPPGTGALKFV